MAHCPDERRNTIFLKNVSQLAILRGLTLLNRAGDLLNIGKAKAARKKTALGPVTFIDPR